MKFPQTLNGNKITSIMNNEPNLYLRLLRNFSPEQLYNLSCYQVSNRLLLKFNTIINRFYIEKKGFLTTKEQLLVSEYSLEPFSFPSEIPIGNAFSNSSSQIENHER